MRAEKVLLIAVLVVLLLPIAAALDTKINVRTYTDHKVSIFIYENGQLTLLDSHHADSGESGEVSYTYTSSVENLDVSVKITKNGERIMLEKFEDITAGEELFLRVEPDNVLRDYRDLEQAAEAETNETGNVTEETVVEETNETGNVTEETVEAINEEEEETDATITGNAVSGSDGISLTFIYYIVGFIVLVGVVVLIILGIKKWRASATPTSKEKTKQYFSYPKNREIEEAEKKIREAQRELNKIKNEGKIREAEMKLQEDKKNLQRLKEGLD